MITGKNSGQKVPFLGNKQGVDIGFKVVLGGKMAVYVALKQEMNLEFEIFYRRLTGNLQQDILLCEESGEVIAEITGEEAIWLEAIYDEWMLVQKFLQDKIVEATTYDKKGRPRRDRFK